MNVFDNSEGASLPFQNKGIVPIFENPLLFVLYSRLEIGEFRVENTREGGDDQRPTPVPLPYRTVTNCPSFNMQTPWYQDVKMWVGAASAAFLAISGVFASKEDDDPHLWGVFLGVGALLILVEFVLIAREYKLLCFIPRVKAAGAENEPRGEAYV